MVYYERGSNRDRSLPCSSLSMCLRYYFYVIPVESGSSELQPQRWKSFLGKGMQFCLKSKEFHFVIARVV